MGWLSKGLLGASNLRGGSILRLTYQLIGAYEERTWKEIGFMEDTTILVLALGVHVTSKPIMSCEIPHKTKSKQRQNIEVDATVTSALHLPLFTAISPHGRFPTIG